MNNLIGMVKRSLRIYNLFFYFITSLNHELSPQYQYCYYSYHSCYSNNRNIKQYSTSTSKSPNYNLKKSNYYYLNPYYITGFVDAEGCFTTSIFKDSRMLLK